MSNGMFKKESLGVPSNWPAAQKELKNQCTLKKSAIIELYCFKIKVTYLGVPYQSIFQDLSNILLGKTFIFKFGSIWP